MTTKITKGLMLAIHSGIYSPIDWCPAKRNTINVLMGYQTIKNNFLIIILHQNLGKYKINNSTIKSLCFTKPYKEAREIHK